MLSRFLAFALAVLLLLACATPIPVKPVNLPRENYSYAQRYLTWMIEKEMADNNITGLSIAIVDDQKLVWASGFGYGDAENHIRATPRTAYRMGSIAKLFTATATMQLAERGQMNIDQPLSLYLPGFSVKSRFENAGPITPRNIMSHHSGLPANFLNGMLSSKPEYFSTLVKDVRNEYVAYPPNFVFAYSNLAVTLLGAAVEHTSGEKYQQHIQQSIFEPLGMRDSYFSSQPGLKGYRDGKPAETLTLRDLPSGGLVSSVEDLSAFMKMVFAGGRSGSQQLLQPESITEMLHPQNEQVPLDVSLRTGLGWMLSTPETLGGYVVASHGGSLLNFHSELMILPEHKLGVVIASNSANSRGIVNNIALEALKLLLEAKTGITPAEKHNNGIPNSMTAEAISTGYFDTVAGLVKVDSLFGSLKAELMGHSFQISPRNDGWFGVKYNLLGLFPISFSPLDDIRLSMVRIGDHDVLIGGMGSETKLLGEKLQPSPAHGALIDFVGDYELANLGMGVNPTSLALRYEDGMFIAECAFAQVPNMVFRVGVNPISDSEVLISGLGSSRGETIRLYEDKSEKHMLFSGIDMRKIN